MGSPYICNASMALELFPRPPFPLRPSARSLAEQLVGCGLFFFLSLALLFCVARQDAAWQGALSVGWTLYYLILPSAVWMVWRSYSMRTHKVEFATFFFQFFLSGAWALSLSAPFESLLSLMLLMLLFCNALLSFLFIWKKERLASLLFSLLPAWVLWNIASTLFL